MKKELKTLRQGIPILRWDCEDHKIKYFDSATKQGDRAVVFVDDIVNAAKEWGEAISKNELNMWADVIDKETDSKLIDEKFIQFAKLGMNSFIKIFFPIGKVIEK